jgi:hypothetical protein
MKHSGLMIIVLVFTMVLYSTNTRCQNIDSNAILIDKLNGKEGLYKTYEDFLNGKSEDLRFAKWIFHHDSDRSNISLKVKFRNTAGKIVKYSCNEFWGFNTKAGFYRTFPRSDVVSERICYFLSYQNNGYFIWDAARSLHADPDFQALYTLGFAGGATHFDFKKEQPSFLGIECRLKAFVKPGAGKKNDWDATVNNMKACKSVKLMLYYKYKSLSSAPIWKYILVNP